ncbi:MAG TPA: class I SAM-dependent methyltransferase [Dongiaceae bacterium]
MTNPAKPVAPAGGNGRAAISTVDIADASATLMQMASEFDCLKHQAADWEPATIQVLDDVGLQAGMHCLDVGSGIGAVLRLMAQRIGPAGQAVGLDSNSRAGQYALLELHRQGLHQVSFLRGDVNRTSEIAPASFDIVFGRFLLFHMIDPGATLRRMYEWVKPGGCLVIQDYDLATMDVHPHQPLFAEFRRICFAAMAQTDRDIRLGLKLRPLFRDNAGGVPDASRVHAKQTTLTEAAPLIAAVYRAMLPLALELGVTNDRDGVLAQRILDLPDKRSYGVLWPLLHSAWRWKPAA